MLSCYELGHQPIGIALPLGFLERAGYRPESLDLSVQKLDLDKVAAARFIGISVPMHTALRIGVQIAKRVREINSTCFVAFFGLYSSLNAETLLNGLADAVIGGEYEGPLVALIDRLAAGETADGGSASEIPGVGLPGKPALPLLAHLSFATPSRTSLPPLSDYAHLREGVNRRPAGYVEASRGCRHLCRHCPIPPVYEGRFFLIPFETVLEDVRNLVSMGAEHLTFGDPDFLNGPNHSLRIVRAVHLEFPDLTFDFTAKVEHLLKHRALIPEFAALGCRFIVSAVESLSDTVLAHLKKAHTRADVFSALKVVRDAGITLRPSLVTFTPWTTLEEIMDLFEFIEKEKLIEALDPVQYTIRLLIPPGSLLLEEEAMTPYLGPLVQEAFTYRWRHPDPRIDLLQSQFREEVERATQAGEDPLLIFHQLKELAAAMGEGRPSRKVEVSVPAERDLPPRLTEPWFCCAEPTENQFAVFEESEKIM